MPKTSGSEQPRRVLVIEILWKRGPGAVPLRARKPALRSRRSPSARRCHYSGGDIGQDIEVRICRRVRCGRSLYASCRKNALQFARSHHRIDFRNILANLVAISLYQASGNNKSSRAASLLVSRHFQDRVYRLLFRRIDKRAGINDQHICGAWIVGHLRACLGKKAHHDFAVYQIFRTAETDEADARWRVGSDFGRGRRLFEDCS